MENKEEVWQCRRGLFIVTRGRVTAAGRPTLTDGVESITRTLSKELRGNIISPAATVKRFLEPIEQLHSWQSTTIPWYVYQKINSGCILSHTSTAQTFLLS